MELLPPEMVLNIVEFCGTQKEQRAVLRELATCNKALSKLACPHLWSTTTMQVTEENCYRLLCLVALRPELAERLQLLRLTAVMPKQRASTMLQTNETLEQVRRRMEEVMAGCMDQMDKESILTGLDNGLCSVIARSILLFTPNLKKLWVVENSTLEHHKQGISVWAKILKNLPMLTCVHAIHTDFLNLVPFMGASTQAIQAQLPGLACRKKAARGLWLGSILAKQTPMFSSLRCLELRHLTRDRSSITEMTQVLSRCTQLKYLALWFGRTHLGLQDRYGHKLISMIANSPSAGSIQSLSLSAFTYQGQPCANLLASLTVLEELDVPIQVFTKTGEITEDISQAIPRKLKLLSLTGLAYVQRHAVLQNGQRVYQHFRGGAHTLSRSLKTVFLSFDDLRPRQLYGEWSGDGFEALDPDTCRYNAKQAGREDYWMHRRHPLNIPSMRSRELETAVLVYRASSAEMPETDHALEIFICTREGGSSRKTETPRTRI